MAKYLKKVKLDEAAQWWPGTSHIGVSYSENGQAYVITAHQQRAYLVARDWIVEEPDSRGYYPVKDDIFRANHDMTPVE